MRAVWGVLAVLVVAVAATVAVRVGLPSSATRLPGPVTVPAATVGGVRVPTSGGAGAAATGSGSVRVVTPDRPVSSLPAPVGSDSREAEQMKTGTAPTTNPSPSPASTDR